MKAGKVISEEILFEKPKVVTAPAAAPPPPAVKTPPPKQPKTPEPSPPVSPKSTLSAEVQRENMKAYYEWEARLPSTWRREIELLEREREKYNRKAAWSGADLAAVEKIDREMKACMEMVNWLERVEEEEEAEENYDSSE